MISFIDYIHNAWFWWSIAYFWKKWITI